MIVLPACLCLVTRGGVCVCGAGGGLLASPPVCPVSRPFLCPLPPPPKPFPATTKQHADSSIHPSIAPSDNRCGPRPSPSPRPWCGTPVPAPPHRGARACRWSTRIFLSTTSRRWRRWWRRRARSVCVCRWVYQCHMPVGCVHMMATAFLLFVPLHSCPPAPQTLKPFSNDTTTTTNNNPTGRRPGPCRAPAPPSR